MNEPNKLQCYITISWKELPGTNTLAYWPIQTLQEMKCYEDTCVYLILCIVVKTYLQLKQDYRKLERSISGKYSTK
jgi:hypothetical protein